MGYTYKNNIFFSKEWGFLLWITMRLIGKIPSLKYKFTYVVEENL